MKGPRALVAGLATVLSCACAQQPMGYLGGAAGPAARPVQSLGGGFVWVMLGVVAVIAVLLVLAVVRGQRRSREEGGIVRRGGKGLQWIQWGVGLSLPVLVALMLWSFSVTRAISAAPVGDTVDVEVTAHRWWWEIRYLADPAEDIIVTANELVVPVGVPVRLRLTSGDVIHDFWVPKLGPKLDAVPGRWNATWWQADAAGTYVGQCAEYCGLEHARMGIRVRAIAPDRFRAWQQAMRQPAATVTGEGAETFTRHCSGCHAVRGLRAGGIFGPDLTHVGSRATLAAGVLPNTEAGRRRWLLATQQVKPGAEMPQMALGQEDVDALVDYLGELR
jgi:cytochrome c oxidase subunit 2